MTETGDAVDPIQNGDGLKERLHDLYQTLADFERQVARGVEVKGRAKCGLFGTNECQIHLARVRDRANALVEAAEAPMVKVRRWRFAAIILGACAVAGLAGLVLR